MKWALGIAIVALAVAIAALVVAWRTRLAVWRMEAERSREGPIAITGAPQHDSGPVAVVYNPSKKADWQALRAEVDAAAAAAGYPETVWIPTSVEDPGAGQARKALALAPALVIAAGGDGTVRLVAGELAGTGVPLGLLPVGTGNLLARNLDLPLGNRRRLAEIALTGRTRALDMCRLFAPELPAGEREAILGAGGLVFEGSVPFLVISGIGFDAEVMAGANPNLKSSLGWSAYLVSGIQHLRDRKLRGRIRAGGSSVEVEARSVMFANCGELAGGFVLAPNARPDDGWLDITVMDTKGGLIGWGDLVRRVSLQGIGAAESVAEKVLPEVGSLEIRRSRSITVETETLEQVEADGDLLGFAREVTATVEHGALAVRIP